MAAFPDATPAPRVAALLSLAARHARDGEWEGARRLLLAALTADESPRSQIAWGEFLVLSGELDEALVAFHAAWERAKKIGSPVLRGQACQLIAETARRQGDLLTARQFQQLAITAELESGDGLVAERALLGHGHDRLMEGGPAAAIEVFGRIRSKELAGEAQLVSGLAYTACGEFAVARRELRAAWGAFRRRRNVAEAARCLEAIAQTWQAEGEWDRALASYDKALCAARALPGASFRQRLATSREAVQRIVEFLASDPDLN